MKFLKDKFSFSRKKLSSYFLVLILIVFIILMRFRLQDHGLGKKHDREYSARLRALQAMFDKSQKGSKKLKKSEDKGKDLKRVAEYESFYQEGIELYKKVKLIEAAQSFEKALKAKDTKEVRTAISQIYNLLGMKETENKNYDGAIKFFEKSFDILQSNQSLLGMANAYLLKENIDDALHTLERSLELYPENPKTYHHLGQIYYQKGDVEKAINFWQHALELDPQDFKTEMLLNNAKINLGIDNTLLKKASENFQVDFQGESNEVTRDIILTLFQQAYDKIEKELKIYPSSKLKIVLDFNTVLSSENQNPSKNITIDSAKIKVPVAGLKKVTDIIRETITYSYTKFTISDYMNRRCPSWFLEGISLYESNKININQIGLIQNMIRENQFIKLEDLNPSFQNLGKKNLSLAYAVSFTIIDYIVNKYGMISIKELIAKVRAGTSFEDGLNSVLNLSPSDLQRNWENYLKEQYRI